MFLIKLLYFNFNKFFFIFFFSVTLRDTWHITLYKFRVYNIVIGMSVYFEINLLFLTVLSQSLLSTPG